MHLIRKSIAMTNKEILQADMLDILFERRNKLYGAYALRKTYPRRLGTATAAALSLVLLLLIMSFINNNKKNRRGPVEDNRTVTLTQIEIPEKPDEPERPRHEDPPQTAQADHQQIVVVPDELADEPITEQIDIQKAQVGNENNSGNPDDDIVKPVTEENDTGNTTETVQENEPIFRKREIPPAFPGGEEAWVSFLRKFLQTPDDLEPGQRVDVTVRFWVDIDGSVSKPEIIKSGGRVFDNEVLRVLKKMPKWEPAEQNGRKVAVSYTQSFTFLGMEE